MRKRLFTAVEGEIEMKGTKRQKTAVQEGVTTDAEQLLRNLGATGNLRGFFCTVYMIQQVEKMPDAVYLVTNRLYPDTAKRFDASTIAVERNLRTLIKVCWDRNQDLMEAIAGRPLSDRPTNSVFLDMTGAYLRRQHERESLGAKPAE